MKTRLILTLGLALTLNMVSAQVNFNNYKPLRSKGEMPDDFRLASKTKVEQDDIDLGNLDKKQKTDFLERVHYGIDRLLNSGSVTYGDDVSTYIKKVADNLLVNDRELRKNLRYYVVRSNVANAFSTNQGMIFFTTGLMAQFANEAQLAFVLAHEIVHYKNNHVIQSYEILQDKDKRDDIEQLSKYSKEHEFEADREAVKMCQAAGYSKEEIYNSFDVLMFSHLPFDEIDFNKGYFNTPTFHVPTTIFSTKEYKINMDEDFDDELSTHPNIDKRRTAVGEHIEKLSNWKDAQFIFEKKEFYEIRNICRFETIRNRIITSDIPFALYEIYILEQEFPNSESLQAFKAHAWYDLARLRIDQNWRNIVPSEKELEGASGTFFDFIAKHKPEQTYTFALRNVYDIKKKYPENEYIQNIYEKTVKLIANNKRIQKSKFYDITYKAAEEQLNSKKADTPTQPTAVEEQPKKEESGSKYSRIRRSTTKVNENGEVTGLDTVNYHLYGLTDIFTDGDFSKTFGEFAKSSSSDDEEDEDSSNTTSTSKKGKKKNKNLRSEELYVNGSILAGEKLIITNPLIVTNNSVNTDKRSENIRPAVVDAIDFALNATNTNYVKIGGKSGENDYSTKTYNQNAFVTDLLYQISDLENGSLPIVPIDFDQSQLMMSQFGSKKIAYFFYGERPRFSVSFGKIFGFIWFPPSFLMNVLAETTARENAIAAIYTFDLETGLYQTSSALRLTMKPSKMVLRSTMYNLINR